MPNEIDYEMERSIITRCPECGHVVDDGWCSYCEHLDREEDRSRDDDMFKMWS